MARADTLICGSQTVVDNMFDVLETKTDRRLNDEFNAPRMVNMLRVPILVGQSNRSLQGILQRLTFAGC